MDDGTRTRDGRNHNPGLYQLSYVHHRAVNHPNFAWPTAPEGVAGAPGRNRTCNRWLRRPVLYPVELRADRGKLVGAEGFEPPTLCSQSRCATRLRHAPPEPLPRATPIELAPDLGFFLGLAPNQDREF